MSKLTLAFVSSLVILAGVLVSTMYFIPARVNYNEFRRSGIIAGDNEWILQYDIINAESEDINYTISVAIDNDIYKDSTTVRAGKAYTYIQHIYPQQLEQGRVSLSLYREGKVEPIEHATYYIDYN